MSNRTATNAQTLRVDGIPEMLAALKLIDPELRKEAAREIKSVGPKLVSTARALIPLVPMSGWIRKTEGIARVSGKTPPYYPAAARKGVKVRFRGSAGSRDPKVFRLLTLVQLDAAGAVLDMAGRRSAGRGSGVQFVANLNRGHGGASRVVWKAAEANRADVAATITRAAAQMQRTINERTGAA
jgi:hypothetical protein